MTIFSDFIFTKMMRVIACYRLLICRHKTYYISTPIFYANADPHIGHLYSAAIADARARFEKMKQETFSNSEAVLFSTGTDEHGQKIYNAAASKNSDPQEFCDQISARFKDLFSSCGIGYDEFIRTTKIRHIHAVQTFWRNLMDKGFIYKGTYEGWYSIQDEAFLPDNAMKIVDGQRISIDSGHIVEWAKEENYIFRMSKVIKDVQSWYEKNPCCVYPDKYYKFLLRDLHNHSADVSISREMKRVPWGIETPSDASQTIYVWLDALINYLTVAGYPDIESLKFKNTWPADCHLIGRDILKFHAIYWPAFLIASGLELPKQIVVHSHWLMKKRKMSKSLGNVVDPFKLANSVSGERLKYFLLKQGVLDHNCDFSDVQLLHAVNKDISHTLGNCLNRTVSPKLCPNQIYPSYHGGFYQGLISHRDGYAKASDLISLVERLPADVERYCEVFRFNKAIECIMSCVREANALIHRNQLWTLDLTNGKNERVAQTALHCVFETLRVSGILLQIFTPNIASKLLDRLGISADERTLHHAYESFHCHRGMNCPYSGRSLGENLGVLAPTVKPSELIIK